MNSPAPNENPGCVGRLLALLGITSGSLGNELTLAHLPYHVRDDFLSKAEHSFYLVLRHMMGEYFTICTKVNLSDIFYVSNPHENRTARNKIDRKHVDFLICDPKTMKPRFAIELDDATHQRRDRVERDRFVDDVFEAAGLPLVRVAANSTYSQSMLGEFFKTALSQTTPRGVLDPKESYAPKADDPPPYCPSCGQPMVLREAKRGPKRGEKFYGCVNYPRCKEVVPLG